MAGYNEIRGLKEAPSLNTTGNLRVNGILAPGSFSSGGNLSTGRLDQPNDVEIYFQRGLKK